MYTKSIGIISLVLLVSVMFFDPSLSQSQEFVEMLYEKGLEAYGEGNYNDALGLFRGVTEYNPVHSEAFYMMGQTYLALGSVENAVAMYKNTIDLDASFMVAYISLADLYVHNPSNISDLDKAIELLKPFLERKWQASTAAAKQTVRSNLSDGHFLLAKAYWTKGTISVDGSTPPDRMEGYQNLAVKECKNALELNEKNPRAHHLMGYIYMHRGQSYFAVRHFEKVTKFNPKYYEAWCFLGTLYTELEQYGRAESALKQALKSEDFRDRAGRALEKLRDKMASKR